MRPSYRYITPLPMRLEDPHFIYLLLGSKKSGGPCFRIISRDLTHSSPLSKNNVMDRYSIGFEGTS